MAAALLPQSQVVRLIAQADAREFSLFLGAGASISSGVPSVGTMIAEWRRMVYEDDDNDVAALAQLSTEEAVKTVDAWCAEKYGEEWYENESEYSVLFERLYPSPRDRQKHVATKLEGAFPSWCYLYLANVVNSGYFNVVFTTNFDDLVNDALAIFLSQNPVVCAADSEVLSISTTADRPKVIKLHGDYLFERLKNTLDDLESLDPNMARKFKDFAKDRGMVVIGYAGRDRSVMSVVEELLKADDMYPLGIYWGVRATKDGAGKPVRDAQGRLQCNVGARVHQLAEMYPKRFHLFDCQDFDVFMARLHSALKLELPAVIAKPYETLFKSLAQLVDQAQSASLDATIKTHSAQLREQLEGPLAKASNADNLDLLQAQLALGQRDFRTALQLVEKHVARHPDDAVALTAWGDALAMQHEAESTVTALSAAPAKWQEAIQRDPHLLPPRYSLARHYARAQQLPEAIAVCEDLLARAQDDAWLHRTLASLYSGAGRHNDAQREIEKMIEREPQAGDLHAMKAMTLAQRGLLPEALESQKTAVTLQPNNAWFRITFASQLAGMRRWDEAGAEFERAIALDPKNLNFRLQITQFYAMRQQPHLARPHLQAAIAIEPNSAEAHGWLGQLHLFANEFAEAQREMEFTLGLTPKDGRLLWNLALLFAKQDRLALAEQFWKQAIEANPSMPEPYLWLCQLYGMQNRGDELQATLQELRRVVPPAAQQ
ncbi:MAG: tetratricopeptide repeat protein, partial [bacterium]